MESTAATLKQEIVEELLKNVQSPDQLFGPDGLLHQLKGALMERMLDAEMTAHLGFDKNDPSGQGASNSRNGYMKWTPKFGPVVKSLSQ